MKEAGVVRQGNPPAQPRAKIKEPVRYKQNIGHLLRERKVRYVVYMSIS